MLTFFLVLIIVAYSLQRWSLNNALKGIGYKYKFTKQLVEPEEHLELISTITNYSSRFVPFIDLEEKFPPEANLLQEGVRLRTDLMRNVSLASSVYLMPKSLLERRVLISFSQRGTYAFRGAKLSGGDFLGLSEKIESFLSFKEIVVYPKVANLNQVDQMLGGFLGDVSVRRFMMEDPILTVGSREYTGREPLKQISWKQSARRNQLMVNQYDYTSDPVVSVLLDINVSKNVESEIRIQLIEQCFSLSRTVFQLLEQKGIAYDFISNASRANSHHSQNYLEKGLGKAHFRKTLEMLGRSSVISTESFFETMNLLCQKNESNQSVIIITPLQDAENQRFAQRVIKRGSTIKFIYGGEFNDLSNWTETN